jgi:hypothetical protein
MVEQISSMGLILVATGMLLIGIYYLYYLVNRKVKAKQASWEKDKSCSLENFKISMRNRLDYFWKEPMTFAWISLFLIFFTLLGFAIGTTLSIVSSVVFLVIIMFFGLFSIKSYNSFEEKAKAQLTEFEDGLKAAIQAEVSFNGDNIQSFSNEDEAFDTKPLIFEFPSAVTKVSFPLLEKNPKKHTIIKTRKLEFLILSREYFSICRSATTFNLFSPAQEGVPKGCAEKKKGAIGDCNEFYYSQMQNVQYDTANKCIRIIYNADTGHEDVTFPCAKPASKAPLKALKEKLRLTERQKLQKIQEHKHYEDIKDKRVNKEELEELV